MSYLCLFNYKKSHKNSNFKHTGIKYCCFYNASKCELLSNLVA